MKYYMMTESSKDELTIEICCLRFIAFDNYK